jgi:hypothetical protein
MSITVARRAAALLVVPAALLALAAAALGLPPFSTGAKTSAGSGGQAEVFQIAAACHPTFDRFTIRARFARPGYDVRYVRRVISDGSGATVSLLGRRRIRVILRPARGHTNAGANLIPGTITPRCPNLRQVKRAGDFEAVLTFGLGLRRRTGFRVFRLTGPTRVVIDVRH